MEHTKGPWIVSMQGIDDVTNERIIRIATTENNQWGDAEKDKNIIEAAPELLEACKDALNWMRESEEETGKPLGEGLGYKGRMQKPVIANKLLEAIARAEVTPCP